MLSSGGLLKQERIRRGLTLRQVEKETRIREKFLVAIEENKWDQFSSKIYITGIIKSYSNYLGLDSQKMIRFFRRDYEKKDDVAFKRRLSSSYLQSESRQVIIAGIVIIFSLFFIYFSLQVISYLSPPQVALVSPQTNQLRGVDRVHIIGKTEKDASISIFGEHVFPSKQGVFEYDFPLKEGKNELVIEVTGANGKKTVFKKDLFMRK